MSNAVGLGPFAAEAVKKLIAEAGEAGQRMIVDIQEGSTETEFDLLPEWFQNDAVVLVSSDIGDVTITMDEFMEVPGKNFGKITFMNLGTNKMIIQGNHLLTELNHTATKTGYGIIEFYMVFGNPAVVVGGDKEETPPQG